MRAIKDHPRIVVVGSSNTDLVIRCPRLPVPGETLLGGQFLRFAGGKGANQAAAAARAGAQVTFVGAHGDDDLGQAAKEGLKKEGIDVRYFRREKKAPSGVALILLGGRDRQNMIAVAKSANDCVGPGDIDAARWAFARCDAVICSLEIPLAAVQRAAMVARELGKPFILNPAPARSLSKSLLRRVHTLTPNEMEARAMVNGAGDLAAVGEKLRSMGAKHVVITMGSGGAMLCEGGSATIVKAQRVKVVDTVGAGDCFTAWIGVGIGRGLHMPETVEQAVRAATLAVTREGAQAGMPWAREVLSPSIASA